MKRILSLLVAVTMIFSCVGVTALAEGEEAVAAEFVAQVGEEQFETVIEALTYAKESEENVELKLLKDSTELMAGDFEFIVNADVTITADTPVTAAFYNNGTTYDFIFGSKNNDKTITIAENVTFKINDRNIWLGYYGEKNAKVEVYGTLSAGYQLWNGSDTTVYETGVLESLGEALVIRRGKTLTVDGGKVDANYFSILAGNIAAKNEAVINCGPVWISNTGSYVTEGNVAITLDNAKLTSKGNLKSSTSHEDGVAITVKNGSDVSFNKHDGYAASELDANTTLAVSGENTNLGINSLKNNGTIEVTDGGKVSTTGTVTNNGVINVENVDDFSGTVEGNQPVRPTGNIQVAYVSATYVNGVPAVYGEAVEVVANKSFKVEMYKDSTLVGTATLNDTEKVFLNGQSRSITWHAALSEDGDSWWNTEWTNGGLTADTIPNRVELYVDGVKTSDGNVELNEDDLHLPIFAAVTDDDGTITSFVAGTGFLNGTGDNVAKYADSFKTALENGGNITLLRDITLDTAATIAEGKAASVDLNGHKLTLDVTGFAWTPTTPITVEGELTFKGKGAVSVTVHTTPMPMGSAIQVEDGGKLIIEDGNYSFDHTGNGAIAVVYGDMVVNGGAFKSDGSTSMISTPNSADITITDGVFKTFPMDTDDEKTVSLSGGTFPADSEIPDEWFAEGYEFDKATGKVQSEEIGKVAKIDKKYYKTFEEALNAVAEGQTITLLDTEGSEISKELEFGKAISFTIAGKAPKYALPVVTFTNAAVTIKDAEILIPELDARQNATINVDNSIVNDAGDDSIVKSYYNGKINISGNSVVHTMQVTTMGYITVSDTAKLNATWQTNVYGNGMITVEENAELKTAALHLTGQDYSDRDNTDADRVGKPAEISVNGATLTVGKVTASNGADYSYNSSKGINIGTVEGKAAVLNISNNAKVNIFMADGETANIGKDGTVNIDGSALSVACRKNGGNVTLENNGTVNVSGESTLHIPSLTGTEIRLQHNAKIKNSTVGGEAMLYGKVTFSGKNTFNMLYDYGNAYSTEYAEWIVEEGASVTLTEKARYGLGYGDKVTVNGNLANALTARENLAEDDISFFTHGLVAMSNWDVQNSLSVKDAYVVIGSNNSFGNSPKDGHTGTYTIDFDNSVVDASRITFYEAKSKTDFSFKDSDVKVGTFMTRDSDSAFTLTNTKLVSTTTFNGTDEGNYHAGTLTLENSEITYSAPLVMEKGTLTLGKGSKLAAPKITGDGEIVLDASDMETGKLSSVNVDASDFKGTINVINSDDLIAEIDANGDIILVTCDAKIGDVKYKTLAEALEKAQNNETIELIWKEGDAPIAMNGSVFGKSVTITGDATVDWSKGNLFVGRGGAGDGTVTFDKANFKSASDQRATGIHVSGREKETDEKYNGTLILKDSNIELDYLINRGEIKLDNSTLTVKNGFGIAGRPAKETESGEAATATIDLANGSKVVVNNHNGMGVGTASTSPEGYGVMNIDSTSAFEATQDFSVSAEGTMNLNGGNVKINGKLKVAGTFTSTGDVNGEIVKAADTAVIKISAGAYSNDPTQFLDTAETLMVTSAQNVFVVHPKFTVKAVVNDTDKTVQAGESFTVSIVVDGGDYTNTSWKLSYDPTKVEYDSADTTTNVTVKDYVISDSFLGDDGSKGDEGKKGEVRNTYTFKALSLMKEVEAEFIVTDAYVNNYDMAAWLDKTPAAAEKDTVKITNNIEFSGTIKANDPVTYDGKAHQGNKFVPNKEGAEVTYSKEENGTYTTEVPSFTKAGTHTYWYKATLAGHTTINKSTTLVINPAELAATAEFNVDPDFDTVVVKAVLNNLVDSNFEGSVTVTLDGQILTFNKDDFTYDGNGTATSKASDKLTLSKGGVHTVTVAYTANAAGDNYKDAEGTTTVDADKKSISKDDLNKIKAALAKDFTYDGTEKRVTVDNSKLPTGWTVEIEDKGRTDAGQTMVKVTAKNEAGQYSDYPFSVILKVAPKDIKIIVNDATKALGEKDPVFTSNLTWGTEGCVLAQEGDIKNITYVREPGEDVNKSYEITVSFTPNPNYNVEEIITGNLYIGEPVDFKVEVADTSIILGGENKQDYFTGKRLVLVYTNVDKAYFTYDGDAMYDVSDGQYEYCEYDFNTKTVTTKAQKEAYKYVYAIVVDAEYGYECTKENSNLYASKVKFAPNAEKPKKIVYDANINTTDELDEEDFAITNGIYNNLYSGEDYMVKFLKADTNWDKHVDTTDAQSVKDIVIKK